MNIILLKTPMVFHRGFFMVTMDDQRSMKRALELAEKGRGCTSPNPMVGAVILRDGLIVGEGYHARAGLPHAEVNAITQAGDQAQGATMYVSLEPCSHTGRTPPCTMAIIEAGIRRVVCAVMDPNPKVSGGGSHALRQAGIEVDVGLMAEEAKRLNEVYFQYVTTGLPFVTVKIAQTIDGKIAAPDGNSRWISGEASRRFVHRLRSHNDAVLVGVNTVIADNPELTVRAVEGRNPNRIVLDPSLRIPFQSNLVKGHAEGRTIVAASERINGSKVAQLQAKGVETWEIPVNNDHRMDLGALLKKIGEEGMTSLLVEGGATVFTTFLQSHAVHKLHVFIAPMALGSGRSSIGDLGIQSLQQALRLQEVEMRQMNGDVLITGYLK